MGSVISFTVDSSDSPWPELSGIVKDYVQPSWQAVGLDVQISVMDRQSLTERNDANEHDMRGMES